MDGTAYIHTYIHTGKRITKQYKRMETLTSKSYLCVCVYVYVYICVYVHVNTLTCIHTYIPI